MAFFSATANAFSEQSIAMTFEDGISLAKVIPIQPDPVPMSMISGLSFMERNSIHAFIRISVSGLGIRTLLST